MTNLCRTDSFSCCIQRFEKSWTVIQETTPEKQPRCDTNGCHNNRCNGCRNNRCAILVDKTSDSDQSNSITGCLNTTGSCLRTRHCIPSTGTTLGPGSQAFRLQQQPLHL